MNEGKEMLDPLKVWVKHSKPNFENKLTLLEAEHYGSMCSVVGAKESYELDEQGLAYGQCFCYHIGGVAEVIFAYFPVFLLVGLLVTYFYTLNKHYAWANIYHLSLQTKRQSVAS